MTEVVFGVLYLPWLSYSGRYVTAHRGLVVKFVVYC